MIIFPLIFFIWVAIFLIMGGGVAYSVRRRHGALGPNFRKGFLICLAVAIIGPLVVHGIQVAARREAHRETLEQKTVHGGTGSTSPPAAQFRPVTPPGPAASSREAIRPTIQA